MHILFHRLTSNSSKKNYFFNFYLYREDLEAWSSGTWRPIQKILKLGKIHHIRMILSLITYPLSPKIKPILPVYANVSKLPPPLYNMNLKFLLSIIKTRTKFLCFPNYLSLPYTLPKFHNPILKFTHPKFLNIFMNISLLFTNLLGLVIFTTFQPDILLIQDIRSNNKENK